MRQSVIQTKEDEKKEITKKQKNKTKHKTKKRLEGFFVT